MLHESKVKFGPQLKGQYWKLSGVSCVCVCVQQMLISFRLNSAANGETE